MNVRGVLKLLLMLSCLSLDNVGGGALCMAKLGDKNTSDTKNNNHAIRNGETTNLEGNSLYRKEKGENKK